MAQGIHGLWGRYPRVSWEICEGFMEDPGKTNKGSMEDPCCIHGVSMEGP